MDESTQLARRRNLLFAAVALLTLTTLSRMGWQRAELFGASWPWDGFDVLLFRCVLLIPIAALAWLAFAVIDPESNLRVIGRGWWKIGWMPSTVFVLLAAWYVAAAFYGPPEVVATVARTYLTPFYDAPTGTIAWGLLLASIVVGALTEELIFRGFLQRALEGYTSRGLANLAQALAFELVHLVVYDLPFTGGQHLISGLAYGAAFTRTRSLIGPVVLHAAANLVHSVAFATAL